MGGACSTYGRGAYRDWWGNVEERNHLKNPDVDGRIMRYSPDWII